MAKGTVRPQHVSRALRLAVANSIIEAVASCGRRFLSTNSDRPGPPNPSARVSRFELVNGLLWYVDKYKEARIFCHYDPRARCGSWGWRFSDGGTLLDLLKHLRNFIVTGTPINVRYFGPFPQWSCGGDVWGYGEDMAILRDKVKSIIALWEKDQEFCCASCGGDREVVERWCGCGCKYAPCAVCKCIAIARRAEWQQRKDQEAALKTLRPFTSHLRKLGFVPNWDSRAGGVRTWEWVKQVAADRVVNVQLWGDHRHRASHTRNGCMNTMPTDFKDVAGLLRAIDHESTRDDNQYKGTMTCPKKN